jgi:uncharacterized protein (TIGR03437 family)
MAVTIQKSLKPSENLSTQSDLHNLFTSCSLPNLDLPTIVNTGRSMRIRGLALMIAIAGVAVAQTPIITPGGIVNGASFVSGQPINGGSLVSIFGSNFASSIAGADSIPLSTSLGGVTVRFVSGNTSAPAPLLFVNSTQINAQVPWNLIPAGSTQNISVVVTTDAGSSTPVAVVGAPFSPGIFSVGTLAAAQNVDGTLAQPAGSIPGRATHPAKMGDTIIIYATGLGAVDNPIADGDIPSKLTNTRTVPTVLIGGVQAHVSFSGLSPQFVGVNQLNVEIPNVAPGNSLALQIQVGGITSPNSITMAVSQ